MMEMPQISRGRALAYVTGLLLVLAVSGRVVLGGAEEPAPPPMRAALSATPSTPRTVVVHVVGAVRRPGLYELAEGSRIDEAIRKAGGPKPKAALELVNLAAPIADGQQILVPVRGDAAAAAAAADPTQTLPAAKVHLNTATLEQLDALPGVGPVTAQNILDYRTEHGAFQSVDELDAVSGIGPARLEQLKPLVQL
jgi:competence protein ComEA